MVAGGCPPSMAEKQELVSSDQVQAASPQSVPLLGGLNWWRGRGGSTSQDVADAAAAVGAAAAVSGQGWWWWR